jgi:peroxiredoxin
MPINQTTRKHTQKIKILAMVMIGSGLLIFGIAALVLIPRVFPTSAPGQFSDNPPADVNFPAPDIRLQDISGQLVSLADYRGQVVLVNNWATWCPPCRQEMPILDAYFQDHYHQDFVIVAIDSGEPAEMVADFVEQYGLSFPVWLDPGSSALNSFRNNYLPSSYLIDKGGQVVKVWSGAVNSTSLEKNITPLLKD